mgnify:CR=1 FL=1
MRGVLIPTLFGAELMADLFGISMFFSSIAAFTGLPKAGKTIYYVTKLKVFCIVGSR